MSRTPLTSARLLLRILAEGAVLRREPDFDPAVHAFYYARVLEGPSCRWNAWACRGLDGDARPPSCDDPSVPRTVQERAWTSPVFIGLLPDPRERRST